MASGIRLWLVTSTSRWLLRGETRHLPARWLVRGDNGLPPAWERGDALVTAPLHLVGEEVLTFRSLAFGFG